MGNAIQKMENINNQINQIIRNVTETQTKSELNKKIHIIVHPPKGE